MKKILLAISLLSFVGCQGFVDDQGGIDSKIEDFVKNKLYPRDTIESYDFSRFLRGPEIKPIYYSLDYFFALTRNGKKKFMKYHFQTDSLLNINYYKDISPSQ